jgi:type I restriction enzyme R subunit
MPKPLPIAVLEAKKEQEDPLKGMQQAKGYSDCNASMFNMSLQPTGIFMANTTSLLNCKVEPGPSWTFPITST